MHHVKATIILLCYNQELTIGRALESLLRQNCSERYEILVADDCSSDRTRDICEEYARRYPGLIRLMPRVANKGIVDNYFDAVSESKGEYVADCAGDDEWLTEDRLSRQISVLEANMELSAVCCDVEAYDVETGETAIMRGSLFADAPADRPIIVKGEIALRAVLNHTNALPYVLSGALYRKDSISHLLNSDLLRCHDGGVEDVPLIAALGSAGDLMHLPLTGYRYYIDGESASNNLSFEKEYHFTARVASMVRRLGRHYGLTITDQKDFFKVKFPYLAAQVRHSGNPALVSDLRERLREWGGKMPIRGRIHMVLFKFATNSIWNKSKL